jgi:hypothetical protein
MAQFPLARAHAGTVPHTQGIAIRADFAGQFHFISSIQHHHRACGAGLFTRQRRAAGMNDHCGSADMRWRDGVVSNKEYA